MCNYSVEAVSTLAIIYTCLALMATGTSSVGRLFDVGSDVEFEQRLNSHLNQLIIAFFYTNTSQTCEKIRPDIMSLAGKIWEVCKFVTYFFPM